MLKRELSVISEFYQCKTETLKTYMKHLTTEKNREVTLDRESSLTITRSS